MIQRSIKIPKSNSFFLFGARGTGKTTLLQQRFTPEDALFIDLLDVGTFDDLLLDISRFQTMIHQKAYANKPVIVDEVQKLPKLLDYIHMEIQRTKRQFILTGSSSRKLKQKGTNLLAGRAWVYELHPYTYNEIRGHFDLKKVLEWGCLPESIELETNADKKEFLQAYVMTYLQKEIQQEQWVRQLAPFRKFLAIAAQMNGKIINKSSIARQVGIDDVTVANYFEILEDTLLGMLLPAFNHSVRKSQTSSPKFYFFDTGVKRALEKTLVVELLSHTKSWGDAFEHWLILELVKHASYQRLDWDFSYFRTKAGLEIDLVIKRPGQSLLLMEIKSKSRVTQADAKALELLGPDLDSQAQRWLVSCDPMEQLFGKTRALSWQNAIKELFGD